MAVGNVYNRLPATFLESQIVDTIGYLRFLFCFHIRNLFAFYGIDSFLLL